MEFDPESALELAWSVGEVRRLVNQLLTFLPTSRNRNQRLGAGAGLDTRPARLVDESAHELPRPSGLPLPDMAPFENIDIRMPGSLARLTPFGRERHFRTELGAKAEAVVRKGLEEQRSRLLYWLSTTIASLEDSYHIQTDPLRYRNGGQVLELSGERLEQLQRDILFLRGQTEEAKDNAPAG